MFIGSWNRDLNPFIGIWLQMIKPGYISVSGYRYWVVLGAGTQGG